MLEVFRRLEEQGFTVTYVPVDEYGLIDLEALAAALGQETTLVSIMYVNNEVGSIMPLADIARFEAKAPQASGM